MIKAGFWVKEGRDMISKGGRFATLLLSFAASQTMTIAPSHADPGEPKVLADVLSCRAIAQADARLACFDRNVQSLEAATSKRDVTVMDRQAVQKARRSLFGFSVPNLPFLGSGDTQSQDEPRTLETTAQAVTRNREGQWLITLPDGAVWQQVDQYNVFKSPHPGSKVTIKHAALGSFFLAVDGQIAFRARRIS